MNIRNFCNISLYLNFQYFNGYCNYAEYNKVIG